MSTKNLRELVEMAEEAWPGRPINAVARKELEAIERTVKVFSDKPLDPERRVALFNLAHSIAKDAP